ncbi:hypothetical protein GGR64_000501 [Xanthomonas arboricola]|nr:hypothetical protein [Xanthomonas sp. 3307]
MAIRVVAKIPKPLAPLQIALMPAAAKGNPRNPHHLPQTSPPAQSSRTARAARSTQRERHCRMANRNAALDRAHTTAALPLQRASHAR